MSLIVGVVSLGAMVVVGQVGQNLCNLTPQETFSKARVGVGAGESLVSDAGQRLQFSVYCMVYLTHFPS